MGDRRIYKSKKNPKSLQDVTLTPSRIDIEPHERTKTRDTSDSSSGDEQKPEYQKKVNCQEFLDKHMRTLNPSGHAEIVKTTTDLYNVVNDLVDPSKLDKKIEAQGKESPEVKKFKENVEILHHALGIVHDQLEEHYSTRDAVIKRVANSMVASLSRKGLIGSTADIWVKNINKDLDNDESLEEGQKLDPKHKDMLKECMEVHRVLEKLKEVAESYVQARENSSEHDLGKNVFSFAGHDFIVDHDNNDYIVPYQGVQEKGWIKQKAANNSDKIVKVDQKVHTQRTYDYSQGSISIEKYTSVLPSILRDGKNFILDETKLCLYLASISAEIHRNPHSRVATLLVMAGWASYPGESNSQAEVYKILPMTQGKSDPSDIRFGMAEVKEPEKGMSIIVNADTQQPIKLENAPENYVVTSTDRLVPKIVALREKAIALIAYLNGKGTDPFAKIKDIEKDGTSKNYNPSDIKSKLTSEMAKDIEMIIEQGIYKIMGQNYALGDEDDT